MLTVDSQRPVGRWLWLTIVLVLCGLGLSSVYLALRHRSPANDDGPTLSIGLDNCWDVEAEGDGRTLRCSLDPDPSRRRIRIILRAPTDAELRPSCQGCKAEVCAGSPYKAVAARCLDVDPDSSSGERSIVLQLSTRSQLLGERRVRLVPAPRTVVEDFQLRWRTVDPHDLTGLRALIPPSIALAEAQPPGPLRDRAQILSARIRYEVFRNGPETDASALLPVLQQALLLARQRRWLGSEAELSQSLAWLYWNSSEKLDVLDGIERLTENQEWLPLLPSQKIHSYRLLTEAALDREDFRRIERYLDEARADAALLRPRDADLSSLKWQLQGLNAAYDALAGSHTEAAAALNELENAIRGFQGSPCRQARLWGNLGWLELRLFEIGWSGATDPIPALQQALLLRTQKCERQPLELANSWANLARARSAVWLRRPKLTSHEKQAVVQATREALVEMRNSLGTHRETYTLRQDRLFIEVRLHLLEGSPAKALEPLEELAVLAQRIRSPLTSWLVMVHKAEVLAALGQADEAIAMLRQAEEPLLQLMRQVPIYQARRLILSRFDYSTQRAMELAVRTGRPELALEILRQAGQRSLGLTSAPWWPEQKESAGSVLWARRRVEQARYQEQRRDHESQIVRAYKYTAAQCQDLESLKTLSLQTLDALFSEPAPAPFQPPAIPPGELLIGCMQQQSGWLCLGSSNESTTAVSLPGQLLDEKAIEEILLPALATKLRSANQIRVLGQGALAQLPLAGVKFEGRALGAEKLILRTVDRPPIPASSPVRKALAVFDPEGNLFQLSRKATDRHLASAFESLQVVTRSARVNSSRPHDWIHGEALSTLVLPELQNSDVFFYLGHVAPIRCSTNSVCCASSQGGAQSLDPRLTALRLSQETAITTADVLVAERLPKLAILLGCASADRSAQTPTEMLGLAQAFAIRGTQVLAFGQPIDVRQAEEVLCALGQQRLSDPGFHLGRFLMDTQRRFARGERCRAQAGGTPHPANRPTTTAVRSCLGKTSVGMVPESVGSSRLAEAFSRYRLGQSHETAFYLRGSSAGLGSHRDPIGDSRRAGLRCIDASGTSAAVCRGHATSTVGRPRCD